MIKKYLPYCIIAIFSVLAQFALIYVYAPTPADFKVQSTITGIYKVSGGEAGTRVVTEVNGVSLMCSINYGGPRDSCSTHLRDLEVTVKQATYRHVFGTGEVVMEISSKNGDLIRYRAEDRIRWWWRSSIMGGFNYALMCTVIVGIIYFKFLNRKNKNGK
jgi:hypothetical protein